MALRRGEAYRLLADVLGWFCEGFDTTDLHQAQALLDLLDLLEQLRTGL